MILVVGATGLVGSKVCSLLAGDSNEVRALTRSTSDPEKKKSLQEQGVECVEGDLKDFDSLARACEGVEAVVSTASATLTRQEGDTLATVDRDGQIALIDAAQRAGVKKFVYVSVPVFEDLQTPLVEARRAVEHHLAGSSMDYTILRANYFMEAWLGPNLGFDHANAKVTIYGEGDKPLSFVSFADVAAVAAKAVTHEHCRNATLDLGGPAPVTPNEAIEAFEKATGKTFEVTRVPTADLEAQFEGASDPLQKSFAGLMLAYSRGVPMDSSLLSQALGIELTSVEDYAAAASGQ